ncbi:hypothetical protein AOC05_11435 [Arthrobacter alpinus]|uniref:DUF8173 domain-containing protein n=1 Tax=Arthrobacter alpinus TaxID=656366 RepID=A0A0M4RPI1_9MICC|nr:polymer-forming cytoskeletal protein [Arthrobacter alpinus]ALE92771.1 hypothetical protein AOC05_11435 [Arthrobacter alpinus]
MRVLSPTYQSIGAVLLLGFLAFFAGMDTAVAAPTPTPSPAPAPAPAVTSDSEGPQFYSDLLVDVSGVVNGDVYASGQDVTISGNVTGDVIAAAQTIKITGTVGGNIRLAGQNVTISGDVSRSATIFAGSIIITETGKLGNDLVGAASDLKIAGDVGRDLLVSVDRLSIDGSVGGNLTYYSDTEGQIAQGAVDGAVKRVDPPQSTSEDRSPGAAFIAWLLGLLYALVALSLVTLFAGLLFPRWLRQVTYHLMPSPWKALLVGFLASIAVPVALLVLLVTIIGAPLALAGFLVWIALTLATFVYGAFYIGRLLFRGDQHPVVKSFVGGLILITALHIPWLNIVVWLAMVFFGLGAQLLEFHSQRPWRTKPEVDPSIALAPLPDTAESETTPREL